MTQIRIKTASGDDAVICPDCGAACDAEDAECRGCGARIKTEEVDGFKKGIC